MPFLVVFYDAVKEHGVSDCINPNRPLRQNGVSRDGILEFLGGIERHRERAGNPSDDLAGSTARDACCRAHRPRRLAALTRCYVLKRCKVSGCAAAEFAARWLWCKAVTGDEAERRRREQTPSMSLRHGVPRLLLMSDVRREGLEPTTNGLRVRCSTIELTTRRLILRAFFKSYLHAFPAAW